MQIEQAIHALFLEKKITLGLAESCTGGSISSRLVALAGASNYFVGSVVAYADEVKRKVLGVKEATLREHGAVSEETVKEMAEGALRLLPADYVAAVSGIAGPGPDGGTICAAVAHRQKSAFVWRFQVQGDRKRVIQKAGTEVLQVLWQKITEGAL